MEMADINRYQQTSSGIKTLPGKKEKDCCVCSNCKKPEIERKRTQIIWIKCDKGLHGTCLSKHKCGALRDLVPFVQFKKCEKHQM